jgi:hypothetical protein
MSEQAEKFKLKKAEIDKKPRKYKIDVVQP